jgi:hypothetical protein
MTYSFFIPAAIPNKKDCYAPRSRKNGGKGLCIPQEIKDQLHSIQLIIQGRWNRRDPLTNASLAFEFHIKSRRFDLDGHASTLQDCLVQAGVLKGDNALHVIENHYTFKAVRHSHETGVLVSITGEHVQGRNKMGPQRTAEVVSATPAQFLSRERISMHNHTLSALTAEVR